MNEVTPQPDPSTVGAFFDVDETLVRGASAYWAAKEMFARSFFGFRDILYAAHQTFRYVLFGENKGKIDDFSDRAAQLVAGTTVEEKQRMGVDIYEKYFIPKVYQTTYELLKEHVDAGHTVYLISATPWLIAEEIARQVGAMGGIGTKTKVSEGRLVGEVDGKIMHGEEKALAVLEIAEENDLDLSASWAYSDSANDIPMLSTVGNPVAVNPDRALRAHAKAHGWPIVTAYEIADVIKRGLAKGAVLAGGAGVAYLVYLSGRGSTRKVLSAATVRRDQRPAEPESLPSPSPGLPHRLAT